MQNGVFVRKNGIVVLAAVVGVMLLTLLVVVLPGQSQAARNAKMLEHRAITIAVATSKLTKGVPAYEYTVDRVRISTVNVNYAIAQLNARPEFRDVYQNSRVAMHKTKGKWTIVDLGTAGIGCKLPKPVRTDLKISEVECSSY